jgi:hypothetical protein
MYAIETLVGKWWLKSEDQHPGFGGDEKARVTRLTLGRCMPALCINTNSLQLGMLQYRYKSFFVNMPHQCLVKFSGEKSNWQTLRPTCR